MTPQPTPPPQGPFPQPPPTSKTIGDLVNGEIERTLEISHHAAVNMSTSGTQFMERAFNERATSNERLLINLNAQRPERVHVRPLSEESQEAHPTNYVSSAGGGAAAEQAAAAGQGSNNSNLSNGNTSNTHATFWQGFVSDSGAGTSGDEGLH